MSSSEMTFGVRALRAVTAAQCGLLREKGLDRVRLSLPWGWVERRPGARDWTALEKLLEPALSAGLGVVGIVAEGFVHQLPAWVIEAGGADWPDYPARLAEQAAETARRFPGLAALQVEEATNAWLYEWARTRRRRGRNWASAAFRERVVAAAAAAVRAAAPRTPVVLTVSTDVPGWRSAARALIASPARPDVLGLRCFPCNHLPLPSLAERVGAAVEAARDDLGDLAVEVSGCGFPTHRPGFTHARQREFLAAAARAARRAGATGFTVETLRDQVHDDPELGYWVPDRDRHLGLWRYDGTPKVAFDELRVVARDDRYG